jgi:hypothetical protein
MYNTKEAFNLYVFYLAVKRHFTSDYDFFRYNGKVNASQYSFENRKDKYQFYKLSKHKRAKELILSNVIANPDVWVGDLLTSEADTICKEWMKRQQSLSYVFRSEIKNLGDDFDTNFIVRKGEYPPALKLYNRGKIGLETLVILTDLTGCLSHWNKNISDSLLWPRLNNLVEKTQPFLTYSKEKMRQIVLDRYDAI